MLDSTIVISTLPATKTRHPVRPIEFGQIAALLPHRYPFLLVDRIDDYQPGEWIRGSKNVNAQDILMRSRGHSHYPAALVVESIGQLGIALFNLSRASERPADIVLGSINDVRIHARIAPDARLRIEARIERLLENGLILSGRALLGDVEVISVGTLIAMVDPR
ncbi:MAG: 3-hydroxyacyl-ACP dehydratase FabZ family protein [Gammaproteobacteria bacterium]